MQSPIHKIDPKVAREKGAGAPPPFLGNSSKLLWTLYLVGLIISDVIVVGLAFWLAYFIRFEWGSLPVFVEVVPGFSFYRSLSLILIPLWLLIFTLMGLYNQDNLLGGTQEYALVFRATTTSIFVLIVAGFLEPAFIYARGWLLLMWVITFFLAAASRFSLRRVIYALRQRGYLLTPVLIIGANAEGRLLAEQLLRGRRSGLYVLGFVDDDLPIGTNIIHRLKVLGNLDGVGEIVEKHGVGELVLATSAFPREKMLDVFKMYGVSDNVNLRLSSGLFEIITTGLQVKELAYVPLVRVNKVRLTGIDSFLKLLLDYGFTVPGLILISPLLILIAVAIKLDSPGPVMYRRQVMGLNGNQFDAFKFRTMYVNGDEILEAHPELKKELARNHKIKNDPRVTRVGQILRKYSLDELPQLLNVLRNEMSLVGPRMISPVEMEMYDQWGINLLTVRPGLTGLWQVSGRSDVSYQERVRLDMQYIRNWNIWMDLYLLMQTIPVVLKGRGAY